MFARHATGFVSGAGSPKSPELRFGGVRGAITKPPSPKPTPPKDLRQDLAAWPVPLDTKCTRRFRRFAIRDFPVCTLPDRHAEASAFRSRGTVRLRLRRERHRGGVSRRANTRRGFLPELARRFFREGKYPQAFSDLPRARDFQFLFVLRLWFARTRAAWPRWSSHFFRLLQRPSFGRAECLPLSQFPFQRWQFRAAVLCRLRWFLRPRFARGISLRVRAILQLRILFSCEPQRFARARLSLTQQPHALRLI